LPVSTEKLAINEFRLQIRTWQDQQLCQWCECQSQAL